MTTCSVLAQATVQSPAGELCDKYFFTGDNESLNTPNHARVTGQRGSLLELRSDGTAGLLVGTVTVTTSSAPLKVSAGSQEILISPSSQATIRNNNSLVVSVNKMGPGNTIGITNGASSISNLRSGETFPPGETPINALVAHGNMKPLFLVGKGMLQPSGPSQAKFLLSSSELFFGPSRDMEIETPLGLVTAGASARFLISVAPGTVRIFNCRSGEVEFRSGRNFRRIMPSEEFCVFDHRPTKDEVLPADGIGRKQITMHDLDREKTTASTNNFSVVSLLTSPYFLGNWKRSSAFDKTLVTSLIKCAAAHSGANPDAEAFYETPASDGAKTTASQ